MSLTAFTTTKVVRASKRARPDGEHVPAKIDELLLSRGISFHVAVELGPPEGRVALGIVGEAAARVSVPEAAMHEYDSPMLRKHNVRRAG